MPRREDASSQYWQRVQLVMKVQMGLLSAAEAAQELGLTVRHYYRIEEEMLQAALGAVTPEKPGPKPPEIDPVKTELEEQLRAKDRESELLKIKVQHLEEIQREMTARSIGVERGKKVAGRLTKGKSRPKVQGRLQADGSVARGRKTREGRGGEGPHRGDGPRQIDALPVEGERNGDEEDGPQGAGC